MSLMLFLLVTGMKGTSYIEKLFWVVLSYALASGNYLSVSNGWRKRNLVLPPHAQSVKIPSF